jgi:hypothetical protein
MDVDPDAAIVDTQNATTAHFVFVPSARNIRKKRAADWRGGPGREAVGA